MTKNEILEYFKDINHAYNDCTRYDTLKRMLDELQEPCTDAISRQAAIDELYKMLHDCFGADDEELDAVITTLNELPPVTPQYTDAEIQKMQDLEFAEIQKAYEIGKAEKPNKWIPVSERLPEEYGEYLITWTTSQSKRPFIAICECEISNIYNHDMNRFDVEWLLEDCIKVYPDVEVIAWMPLPEPYKASPTGAERTEE